jgi:hypothetical protein
VSEEKVRPFLIAPAIIDWLQWADFPEKFNEPNYPKLTLELIAEYKAALKTTETERDQLQHDFVMVNELSKLLSSKKDERAQIIIALQARHDILVEAYGPLLEVIKKISKNTYGTEVCNTDEENNEILAQHFFYHQNIAREALAAYQAKVGSAG